MLDFFFWNLALCIQTRPNSGFSRNAPLPSSPQTTASARSPSECRRLATRCTISMREGDDSVDPMLPPWFSHARHSICLCHLSSPAYLSDVAPPAPAKRVPRALRLRRAHTTGAMAAAAPAAAPLRCCATIRTTFLLSSSSVANPKLGFLRNAGHGGAPKVRRPDPTPCSPQWFAALLLGFRMDLAL